MDTTQDKKEILKSAQSLALMLEENKTLKTLYFMCNKNPFPVSTFFQKDTGLQTSLKSIFKVFLSAIKENTVITELEVCIQHPLPDFSERTPHQSSSSDLKKKLYGAHPDLQEIDKILLRNKAFESALFHVVKELEEQKGDHPSV